MSDDLDPNDFVITRKRKKYRFAKFHNAPNCFELDTWQKRPIDVVKVGAGTALFSVELASRHPERTYLALDVKADRLQKGAYEALERQIDNVYFVRARADQIDQVCEAASLVEIWLTFSDPFPRKRSAGRRLTHPSYLDKYAALLQRGGRLCIKHDNPDFFAWTLEQLSTQDWSIDRLCFDLHDSSDPSDDAAILTSYEQRWLGEGRRTSFVSATHKR